MRSTLVAIILQVLAIQPVFTYPARDYILAYVPVEEYVYLTPAVTSTVELLPISGYLVFPDSYVLEYYDRPMTTGRLNVVSSSQSFPVYSSSPALTVSQPGNVATMTVSPSIAVTETPVIVPEAVILPSAPIEVTVLPTDQDAICEGVDEGEFIEEIAIESIVFPETTVIAADVLPDTAVITANAPVTGKVVFDGNLQASGTVRIYANCY